MPSEDHASMAELRALISSQDFGPDVEVVWVYGSRAIAQHRPESDVDLIIVTRGRRTPMRSVRRLPTGMELSCNFIGRNSLGKHSPTENGGFFFSSKLLGPRYLLDGAEYASSLILREAFAGLIYPWSGYVLSVAEPKTAFSAEELTALLFLLFIRMNASYACYVTQWRRSSYFVRFWKETVDIVRRSMEWLGDQGLVILTSEGLTFSGNVGVCSDDARRIYTQYLDACFWQFQLRIRPGEDLWIEQFFRKQQEVASHLSGQAIAETIMMFKELTGARKFSS
jgi:hypothetical protein